MTRHCPTCTCTVAEEVPADDEWHLYSRTTTGLRTCIECSDETMMPGPKKWAWRKKLGPVTSRRRHTRAESLCPKCQKDLDVLLASPPRTGDK